jgi:hypothetical protein
MSTGNEVWNERINKGIGFFPEEEAGYMIAQAVEQHQEQLAGLRPELTRGQRVIVAAGKENKESMERLRSIIGVLSAATSEFEGLTPEERKAKEKQMRAAKKAREEWDDREALRAREKMLENEWKKRPHFLALIPIAEDEHHYFVRVDRKDGSMKFDHIDMYGLVDASVDSYASIHARYGRNNIPTTETWFAESSDPRPSWATVFTHHNARMGERDEKNPIKYGVCDCDENYTYIPGNHNINMCNIVGYSELAPGERHPGNWRYDDLVLDVANRFAYLKDAQAKLTKRDEHVAEIRRKREQRKAERAARKAQE